MNEVRTLFENYWINKATHKELYNKTKREIAKYRRFVTEQLGWRLIVNERILKIEKIPAYAEAFMGISEFTDERDYCILCSLLMFLEDKEDNEEFLLSELVDVIELQLKEYMDVDWTKFVQRKSLIRVLQFAEKEGMLDVYEGSSDNLSGSIEHEVLYENTGLSRYFATNFNYDISEFQSYNDFQVEQLQEVQTDRGHFRINRVYRQLVSAPAMYWKENDDQDAIYVKNQRQWVHKNLDDNIGGQLHIHKNAAFFVMNEDDCFGGKHPRDLMISELVLVVCGEIRSQVNEGVLVKEYDDCIKIKRQQFKSFINLCKDKYSTAWSKEYREMDMDKIVGLITSYMEKWMLLSADGDDINIYPAVGKITGIYPKNFKLGIREVSENE
ncbi:TIGR02678 family protein [Clostridium sp. C2-6-12]|uniref:TIGR02678 family protein n=1 Tax=Clostridium sp. C2-6-12 TaxID=2698832 RepID=UPI001371597A|nr:TIGR02678 family protein [Clostridium sp. C2-6-12]